MNPTANLLASVAHATEETEFYTPMPPGYKPGKTKYVGVFGTVMSGLGKGILAASLAKIMKDKGLTVAPIKLEGYLNLDSGTLNPFRHGEVFVLDDGMECDMDLGTYERMLDQDLTRLNFSTSGQIFSTVLEKERRGGYLGRDVQMIPHVTGEVKSKLRQLAVASDADVLFVEIGGTVGDVENAYYIEALRELAFEEGPASTCWVALTYIPEPPALGEQKSKPAQLGIRTLLECGIQPHIIACRASRPVTNKAHEKIALYSSVAFDRVFSMHDCESIYEIPRLIRDAGLDTQVVNILQLGDRIHPEAEQKAIAGWDDYLSRLRLPDTHVTIGIAGKYTSVRDSYASVIKALEHSGARAGAKVEIDWIDVSDIVDDRQAAERLAHLDGIIVPAGFGSRSVEGKIACVKHARTAGLPYLGICLGFQMAVIEFARSVCGMAGANSTEFVADCEHPVIDILPEQKQIEGLGGNMRLGGRDVILTPNSLACRQFSHAREIRLRFRHRYEVDPRYIAQLEAGGLVFSGKAPDFPIMQVLELPQDRHPYFIATQAHPELTSRPLRPDPFFLGLVQAAAARKRGGAGEDRRVCGGLRKVSLKQVPTKVNHILETVLYGSDLWAMERFYTGVVGLRKVGDFSPRGMVFRVSEFNVLIVFDPAVTSIPSDPIPAHGAQGPGHVAFAIDPLDLAAWRERLRSSGIPIEKEVDWPQALEPDGDVGRLLKRNPRARAAARSIYFRDPAGNSVELITGDIWAK